MFQVSTKSNNVVSAELSSISGRDDWFLLTNCLQGLREERERLVVSFCLEEEEDVSVGGDHYSEYLRPE